MTYSAVNVGQGGTGTVNVSGAGFDLTTTNIIQIGATSQGALTISNGGTVKDTVLPVDSPGSAA